MDDQLLIGAVTHNTMRNKIRIQGSWAWGAPSLLAGGYLVGGVGGALLAFGAMWIASAVASEICAHIIPIAMWVTVGPIRHYDQRFARAFRERQEKALGRTTRPAA
jgi:hypothetical protein